MPFSATSNDANCRSESALAPSEPHASTNTPAFAARCSAPTQRSRLVEIRDNLIARIAEAEQEGWLGEIEGLEVSLAGTQDKLAQLDAVEERSRRTIDLAMPTFPEVAGRCC